MPPLPPRHRSQHQPAQLPPLAPCVQQAPRAQAHPRRSPLHPRGRTACHARAPCQKHPSGTALKLAAVTPPPRPQQGLTPPNAARCCPARPGAISGTPCPPHPLHSPKAPPDSPLAPPAPLWKCAQRVPRAALRTLRAPLPLRGSCCARCGPLPAAPTPPIPRWVTRTGSSAPAQSDGGSERMRLEGLAGLGGAREA